MKCLLCEEEKTHKFYWEFFKTEYDESKWCYLCEKCITRFLKASNVYSNDNSELWIMYREIEAKINQDQTQYKRVLRIKNQRRY